MQRLQEFVRLHRLGLTDRRAARELRMGRNTLREYRRALAAAGVLDGSADELPAIEVLIPVILAARPPRLAPQQVSTIEAWQPAVEALLACRFGPHAIHARLRLEQPEFRGSLASVKRLVMRIRLKRQAPAPLL
jgi:hypothetical protein